MSHPYISGIGVRVLVWFTPKGTVTLAAAGFDKGNTSGEHVYTSAAITAEAAVDQWKREHCES